MRARDVSLFVICVGISAPLIMMTGIFSAGPEGFSTDYIRNAFVVGGAAGVITMLAAGGTSIMGYSFKVPAVLGAFLTIYVFCVGLITTLVGQMFALVGAGIAAIFSGLFIALFAVLGYFAALEIAGGPHGPFE